MLIEIVKNIGSPTSIILSFLFGLIVGSFLNVVILRYNTGKSLAGRSGCFSCGHTLAWYELIPVVSYFLQNGKCRSCKSEISIQYPLVELLTGVLFALIAWQFMTDVSSFLFFWVIWALLVVITVYDFHHKIIPDGLVYALIGFTFIYAIVMEVSLPSLSLRIGAGVIGFLFFASLWYFSAGRWMGFGDAKLALGLGFLLGPSLGAAALVLSFWIGALYGLIVLSLPRSRATLKSEVPFAPFLTLGAALSFFAHVDFSTILHFLSFF